MRKSLRATAILAALLVLGSEIICQTNENSRLGDSRISISVRQRSFYEILGEISVRNQIPIGVLVTEGSEPKSCRELIDLHMTGVSINDLMNRLISQCPIYTWIIDADTINVLPKLREESLLDVSLADVQATDKTTNEILDLIFNSSEIKGEMRSRGLKREESRAFPSSDSSAGRKYSLKLQNQYLRQVLNYLIKNTDNKFWVLHKVSSSKNWIALNVL